MDEMIGKLVRSKAGHDKNQLYVVVGADQKGKEDFVMVADGKNKCISSPKRKNKKHLQMISDMPMPEIPERVLQKKATNEEIKRAIKLYENIINHKE
ncbi:MAG: hypothetical protein ACI4DU_10445 [Lachnospiraceae bacterium]